MIRKAAAVGILMTVVPPVVGEAVTPPWEEAGPVRLWARGAALLAVMTLVRWAMEELGGNSTVVSPANGPFPVLP